MNSRRVAPVAAATLVSALTVSAQTFTTHTYSNNNLWGQNGGPNSALRIDLNGDGRQDFVSPIAGSFSSACSGSFAVTLSKGDGSYSAPVCYKMTGYAVYFAAGDFNGNGTLDLAVTDDTNHIHLYVNNGTGTLTAGSTLTLGAQASGIVAADVNHDGRIDLVYDTTDDATGNSTLNVLLGDGRGGFTLGPITDFNMNKEPAGSLAVGDFDSDGHADILVLGVTLYENEILYGEGQGNFTIGPIVGGNRSQLAGYAPFDINSNGTTDLIGVPYTVNSSGQSSDFTYLDIEWSRSDRTLSSQHVTLKGCPSSTWPPQVADFDGDGINDILVPEMAGCQGSGPFTMNFMKGNGNGTFQPEKVLYSTGDEIAQYYVLRASHSSKPDLTVSQFQNVNGTISNPEQLVLVNTTSGNFPTCTPPNFRPTRINNCGPTSSVGATSPVTFRFGGAEPTAGRDMELWIDGRKVAENFKHSYANYDFMQSTQSLANGTHRIGIYSTGADYTLAHEVFTLTVGSNVCPLPSGSGLNICSPLEDTTLPASQPVSINARGQVPSGDAIVRMEVWVDGVKKYVTYGSTTLKTSFALPVGLHKMAFYLFANNGSAWKDVYTIAVQ